jgi:hypothetical protein
MVVPAAVFPIILNFILFGKAAAFVAQANIGKNDVIRHDKRDAK